MYMYVYIYTPDNICFHVSRILLGKFYDKEKITCDAYRPSGLLRTKFCFVSRTTHARGRGVLDI